MSTYKNPDNLIIQQPYNVDAEIQRLQVALRDELSWLDESFGRAELGRTKEGGKEILYPEVYTGEKRKPYQNVLPNNKLTSQSFWRVHEPLTVPQPRVFEQLTFKLHLSVVFWFDLVKIGRLPAYQNLDYRFYELLLSEVIEVLRMSGVEVHNIYYTPDKVYENYTINHLKQQELKHPYSGFRIEIYTSFLETCL